jgi:hypothetical protein
MTATDSIGLDDGRAGARTRRSPEQVARGCGLNLFLLGASEALNTRRNIQALERPALCFGLLERDKFSTTGEPG